MKKLIPIIAIVLVIGLTAACFAGCAEKIEGDLPEDIPNLLNDTDVCPDTVLDVSGLISAKSIYENSSLTDAQKIMQMMSATEQNEMSTSLARFNYFQYKIGTTKLDNQEGTLIYQRLRKQNQQEKDDTTLKLPINHNFGNLEVTFVQSAMIRLLTDNKIYRISGDNKDMTYDEETGLISMKNDDGWSKGKNFGDSESVASSQNLEETKKTVAFWDKDGIIKEDSISIEKKTNEDGYVYYSLSFEVDVDVANSDSRTIDKLCEDNGGTDMKVNKLVVKAQIWECGLMRYYETSENWSGKIGNIIINYEGSADSTSYTFYSYTEKDNDMSASKAILAELL